MSTKEENLRSFLESALPSSAAAGGAAFLQRRRRRCCLRPVPLPAVLPPSSAAAGGAASFLRRRRRRSLPSVPPPAALPLHLRSCLRRCSPPFAVITAMLPSLLLGLRIMSPDLRFPSSPDVHLLRLRMSAGLGGSDFGEADWTSSVDISSMLTVCVMLMLGGSGVPNSSSLQWLAAWCLKWPVMIPLHLLSRWFLIRAVDQLFWWSIASHPLDCVRFTHLWWALVQTVDRHSRWSSFDLVLHHAAAPPCWLCASTLPMSVSLLHISMVGSPNFRCLAYLLLWPFGALVAPSVVLLVLPICCSLVVVAASISLCIIV